MTYQTYSMPGGPLRSSNRARDLLADLVDQEWINRYAGTSKPKPGEIISRLTEEEKKTLRTLRAEDIQVVRWPKL